MIDDKALNAIEQMADYLYEQSDGQVFSGPFMRTRALDIKMLVEEVRELKAKVKSGVEAAHDVQKAYIDTDYDARLPWMDNHIMSQRRAAASSAASHILEAMEEDEYEGTN
jgi:hypothetical protein